MTITRLCCVALAAAALAPIVRAQDCTPQWLNQFRIADVDGTIWDSIVVDDEDGQSLYITGDFYDAGEFESIGIARWSPSGFVDMNPTQTPIGGRSVAYLDPDGAGPDPQMLLAGGNKIQKWDGASWTIFGDVTNNGAIKAMIVFDDGSGSKLWVAGGFSSIAKPNDVGTPVNGLATWDGSSWQNPFPPHFSADINALAIFDDGTGPTLYLGGSLNLGQDQPSVCLARWNGSAFVPVGSTDWQDQFGSQGANVHTMSAQNLGDGSKLYLGGYFHVAGGVVADNVAVWDGSAYAPLGTGANKDVWDLTGFDDGTGLALYAAGAFTVVDDENIRGTAKWTGTDWDPAGSKVFGTARTLAVYEEDADPTLYVGGQFTNPAKNIARLTDTGWEPLGSATNGQIYCMSTLDVGAGPYVYVGGEFTKVDGGTLAANNVAKFDGASWSAMGTGIVGTPGAFATYNPGNGAAVYLAGFITSAGGSPAKHIVKWSGSAWSTVGNGFNQGAYCLKSFNDGGGSKLYCGGDFTASGNLTCNRVARWDGAAMSAVGTGFNNSVTALEVYDDGGGPALYAGGSFTTSGGLAAAKIASYSSAGWAAFGLGVNNRVTSTVIFDDGTGPALYAAGWFEFTGQTAVAHIARWTGSQWAAVGSGIGEQFSQVNDLAVFNDGTGNKLYAAGNFTKTGNGQAALRIASWNGSAWAQVGAGFGDNQFNVNVEVRTIDVADDGNGAALYAGGSFSNSGPTQTLKVAKWSGGQWAPMGDGFVGSVNTILAFNDGGGTRVYAGGNILASGATPILGVARWDGSSWSQVGGGLGDNNAHPDINAFVVFNDGNGAALYAGGQFAANGNPPKNIARWTGSSWVSVGAKGLDARVRSMAVYDDGTGPMLYIGGDFVSDGTYQSANLKHLTRWDGSAWQPMNGTDILVASLASLNVGGSQKLIVGGDFDTVDSIDVNAVARWTGNSWAPLTVSGPQHTVRAMAVFDDGTGPALYMAGSANNHGVNISKWDGSQLTLLPSGTDNEIRALLACADSVGPALYASGTFLNAGGQGAGRIARWDSGGWTPLDTGLNGTGAALAPFQDELGPTVFAGGTFTTSGGISAGHIARWGCAGGTDIPEKILISFNANTAVPGVGTVRNEDVVQYDTGTGQWSFVIDGSDLGLGTATIDALAVLSAEDKQFLLSFTAPVNIGGLSGGPNGTLVDDSDIVKFTATHLGAVTSGTFSFYFDGSDVGLDLDAEDIDALAVTPDVDLLISALGNPAVPGVAGARDEDILKFHPTSLGATTSGSWSMYFDGSDVGLATTNVEDVDAVALNSAGDLILSTLGDFGVPGAVGSSQDLLDFTPATLGANTTGSYSIFETLHLLGIDPAKNVGGLELSLAGLGRPGGPPPCDPDLTDDGELDLMDYLAFQTLFNASDPRADFDHSTGMGVLDIYDFQSFQNSFDRGCE